LWANKLIPRHGQKGGASRKKEGKVSEEETRGKKNPKEGHFPG